MELRLTEIFYSLQGESSSMGLPTLFIRLTGCPLRCIYCDSAYAFKGGQKQSFEQILEKVDSYQPQNITVTGGEPLAQPNCFPFLELLCDKGYAVSLETSGAMPIEKVDSRVRIVMDLKTPSSEEMEKNLYDNITLLKPTDEVKFVIADRADYEWSQQISDEYDLYHKANVLFSPSQGVMDNQTLADWSVGDNLKVRFQLQMHKYIWGDVPGR